ncbi:MAG TPA: protein translocase subunit SecD, partial [Dehalococcoidia bacterium]|nr:protein translocase subunit SecD [Dehalococcoidia bacterium]
RTMKAAIDAGFNRAWPAIRDSNFTTFIACGILYWFGSSIPTATVVMGFAVTLFIGVAVSMFSAIVVTKTLLMLFTGGRFAKRMGLFGVESKAEAKNA